MILPLSKSLRAICTALFCIGWGQPLPLSGKPSAPQVQEISSTKQSIKDSKVHRLPLKSRALAWGKRYPVIAATSSLALLAGKLYAVYKAFNYLYIAYITYYIKSYIEALANDEPNQSELTKEVIAYLKRHHRYIKNHGLIDFFMEEKGTLMYQALLDARYELVDYLVTSRLIDDMDLRQTFEHKKGDLTTYLTLLRSILRELKEEESEKKVQAQKLKYSIASIKGSAGAATDESNNQLPLYNKWDNLTEAIWEATCEQILKEISETEKGIAYDLEAIDLSDFNTCSSVATSLILKSALDDLEIYMHNHFSKRQSGVLVEHDLLFKLSYIEQNVPAIKRLRQRVTEAVSPIRGLIKIPRCNDMNDFFKRSYAQERWVADLASSINREQANVSLL